jgi:hypothetical protein
MQRIHCIIGYANCALAMAAETKDKAPFLSVAAEQTTRLGKENSPFGIPLIPYIMSAIEWLRGNEERSVGMLRAAVTAFDDARFNLFAAAAKRRLGKLLGGDEGQALMVRGEADMREEAVVNPHRVTRLLAPGFPE